MARFVVITLLALLPGSRAERLRGAENKTDTSKISDCTPADQDPWQTGAHVDCCSGASEQLIDDNGNWHYMCYADADDGGSPADDGGSSADDGGSVGSVCAAAAASDDWPFNVDANSWFSCASSAGKTNDMGNTPQMCDGDPSSVRIEVTRGKAECLVAHASDCKIDMHAFESLDYDFALDGCNGM